MKLSFRAKTILGVAAIEAVLLTLLVVSGMRFMSSTAEQQFVQRSQATVKAFSVVAKDALIASDLATLAALTREMLTYPGVVYARVRDERQEVLSQAGESQQLLRAASDSAGLSGLADGVFHSSVEIRVGPQRFGRVEIGVSAAEVQAQQALARRFGLGLAALEMLLVGLFSWVLGSYLTRQLQHLADAARGIAAGQLGLQVPVLGQGSDELAQTAQAFNRMSTELAANLSELQRSEGLLRKVVNTTHDGIIVIDEQGLIESFNAGAEQMFGYRAEEVIGRNVSIIVPPPHQAAHDLYLQRHLLTGESRVMGAEREFEALRRDGGRIWIALRVSRLDLGGGAAGGRQRFIGVVHDITARKRAELELRQAKEAAEAAAQAKSDFLANMSHEIRTPMHGVLGSLEMLQDTPLSGQQQRHLETARTSAGLLLGVIDEILDFSRLEAGKLRIESIDFDLRRTVEDVTAMLATRAHAKKLELACYISPEVPEYLRGDPIRLRQVLVNLLGNAIKFTEQGEVLLSVSVAAAAPSAADSAALRFEVRDTGIGIGEAQQQRLFEPFMQADSSTSRRFGGSGLGLSIAKRLVELMHGAIGLTSREGEGSTFWFTLPLSLADAGLLRRRAADFAGTRVLVVDDNATNRVILHRYLTAWNGHSGSAANGEEALAKLQDAAAGGRPYEVALLDLNMPGMDGYTLVRQIRRDPLLAGLPLIMLSSSAVDSERIGDLGVDIWLDKPVRQSDLYDALATVLHRQGAPTTPAAPMPASGPGSGQGLRFDGERVLLVEDNPITQDVGAQMLRQRGLQVQVAADGQQALDLLDQEAIDLVLMDVQMPGMDGLTATRALRERERTRSIGALPRRVPVVALTAHALPADRERCLAAGMDDYVVKPYSSETLASVVARWLMPPRKTQVTAAVQVPVPVPVPPPVPLPTEPASLPPVDTTPPSRLEIPSGEAIDLKRFAEVQQLMGESTGELIDRVVEALAAEMQACLQARAAADRLTLGDRMHRLKNTAGDIGAQEVYARAARCERDLAQELRPLPDLTLLEAANQSAVQALQSLRQAMKLREQR